MRGLKEKIQRLNTELYTVYLASKHPETPWIAKAIAILVITYALSPIDLIPDFIPVLGLLDDLILVPLGIYLVLKLIPVRVINKCREEAIRTNGKILNKNWKGAILIVGVWAVLIYLGLQLFPDFKSGE